MVKIDNSKNPEMEKVYTDSKGNDWYSLKNVFDLSGIRGIAAMRTQRYFSMMLSEKTLKDLLEEHDRAAKALDITKCFAIVQDIKNRQNLICEENSILDLVNVYYYLKDEDPHNVSDTFLQKKLQLWSEDSICKGFFLKVGLMLTNKLANMSKEDLQKYLEDSQMITSQIKKFLLSNVE